jgi:hypothetical protein
MRLVCLLASVLMFATEASVLAQPEDPPSRPWEYVSVQVLPPIHESSRVTGRVSVCQMLDSGCRESQVEAVLTLNDAPHSGDRATQAAISRALARLGAEGWELVGRGPEGLPASLYLKRPKTSRSASHGHITIP